MYSRSNCTLASAAAALQLWRRVGEASGLLLGFPIGEGGGFASTVSEVSKPAEPLPSSPLSPPPNRPEIMFAF